MRGGEKVDEEQNRAIGEPKQACQGLRDGLMVAAETTVIPIMI